MCLEAIRSPLRALGPSWLILALLAISFGQARAATLETLTSRPGVTETFVLIPAEGGAAKANVILLIGGNGRMGLNPGNLDNPSGNFLARTREMFVAHGFQVALLDAPSDHRDLGDWRASADHATDIAAVIRYLRAKANVPVWLVGTSRGTVSAANAGARLAKGPADARPDGLVLTSSITVATTSEGATVWSSDLDEIRVPVLVVAHRDDHCKVSPPSNAMKLAGSFPNSPKVEALLFDGGDAPRSDACQPFAQHGYLGIEAKVVDAISSWMLAH